MEEKKKGGMKRKKYRYEGRFGRQRRVGGEWREVIAKLWGGRGERESVRRSTSYLMLRGDSRPGERERKEERRGIYYE